MSGLTDAEGCFNVTLYKRKQMRLGYQVKMRFMIDQKDSYNTLLLIIYNLHYVKVYNNSKYILSSIKLVVSN